jgi:tetratricopeptide (TPR) repeat protein
LAKHVYGGLPLGEMPDEQLVALARFFWGKDEKLVKDLCMTMKDKDLGQVELLRYYHWAKDAKRGVPQADKVATIPEYATEAVWKKAELLESAEEYTKAIRAYQLADNPPENVWRIVGCHVKLKNIDKAVALLMEIEAFFKDQAPRAAMRIAQLYRKDGRKKQYIAALRRIMKKYPETPQSSQAHQQLERMGIKMGGGIDAE